MAGETLVVRSSDGSLTAYDHASGTHVAVEHNDVGGRTAADAHSIGAITDLQSTLDGKAASPHALGGSAHGADTLANLNALISDATLDDSADPRDPTAHGASHEPGGADALTVDAVAGTGSLRTLGTGATQAAAGDHGHGAPEAHSTSHEDGGSDEINVAGLSGELADPQPPKAHDLGGAEHNADTLANLNALVSDATLDDSGDARPPTSHTHPYVSKSGDTMTGGLNIEAGSATRLVIGTGTNSGDSTTGIDFKHRYGPTFADGEILAFIRSERQGTSGSGDLIFGTSDTNGTHAAEKMRLFASGELQVAASTWHTSSEGQERLYFASGGNTYIRTASSIYFRNSSNSNVFRVGVSGELFLYGTLEAQGRRMDNVAGIRLHVGSASSPSLTFNSDLNTGFYLHSSDTMSGTAGGTRITNYTSTAFGVFGDLSVTGSKNARIEDPSDPTIAWNFGAVEFDTAGTLGKIFAGIEVPSSREARVPIPKHFPRLGANPSVMVSHATEPEAPGPAPYGFVADWDGDNPEVVIRGARGIYNAVLLFTRTDPGVRRWTHQIAADADEFPEPQAA